MMGKPYNQVSCPNKIRMNRKNHHNMLCRRWKMFVNRERDKEAIKYNIGIFILEERINQ